MRDDIDPEAALGQAGAGHIAPRQHNTVEGHRVPRVKQHARDRNRQTREQHGTESETYGHRTKCKTGKRHRNDQCTRRSRRGEARNEKAQKNNHQVTEQQTGQHRRHRPCSPGYALPRPNA